METFARWLVVAGVGLALVGVILWAGARLGVPLGRLPGDIKIETDGSTLYFPIVTCLIVSLLLTLLLNLAIRVLGR